MQQRVLIEDVKPQIDGGRFYIKRIQGEAVNVTADIFADGHDKIRAVVRYKHNEEKDWTEVEMDEYPNDAWKVTFKPTEKGFYEYQVQAWVDHFLTWFTGFRKKVEAGNDVHVELLEGAELAKALVKKNKKKADKEELKRLSELFADDNRMEEAIRMVMNPAFAAIVEKYPFKQYHSSSERLKIFVERSKALFSTWYEFFPRSASQTPGEHGTFKDCERLLHKVKDMGFDVLYFPPIHPVGEVNRKGINNATNAEPGDVGSPWAIGSKNGGHKAVSPLLGTMQDFEDFIQKSADMGIEVAMDIAFQCAPDHPYIQSNPDWFKWRPDGTIAYAENPPKKYQDIVPIDFETKDWKNLWEELKSVFTFWIKKGVTIFRVDNPHTKSFNFWEWCINEIKTEYPDIIFLAEAFSRPRIMQGLAKRGYNQGYSYFTWRTNKQELTKYMLELTQTEMREYFRPNFWPNTPDILPYELQSGKENRFIYRYALAATLSSNYGMYGPVYEQYVHEGVIGKEEYSYSEKYELKQYDWDKQTRLSQIIKRVNEVRHQNPALQTTWNIAFCETDNDNIIAYFKYNDDLTNLIFVAVNMNPDHVEHAWIRIPKHQLRIGEVDLILDDQMVFERFHWGSDSNFVALDPNKMPFHLCVVTNNAQLKQVQKAATTRSDYKS
jgi:starch synthase (maltosyl-transferring)